ncbi:MAG: hypothetical protein WC890_06645 [Candidatus Margulisiibacteriota bacterium]
MNTINRICSAVKRVAVYLPRKIAGNNHGTKMEGVNAAMRGFSPIAKGALSIADAEQGPFAMTADQTGFFRDSAWQNLPPITTGVISVANGEQGPFSRTEFCSTAVIQRRRWGTEVINTMARAADALYNLYRTPGRIWSWMFGKKS